jgi:hypothetical protein
MTLVLTEPGALANHRVSALVGAPPVRRKGEHSLFCLPDDEDQAAVIARVLMARAPDTQVKGEQGWTAEKVARFRGLDEAADIIAEGS